MTLVASLLTNGYLMTRAERSTRAADQPAGPGAWKALRRTAIASMILWFATAFVGVALVNI
jgi:hypothetical protein